MSTKYTVTALVSVYNAEEFLRGCLEDLVQQSIFAQTEVIIIDACSPQNEQAIAAEFTAQYPNIRYVRTPQRESLYAAWNRGIGMAQGKYITNANADDRHAPHAFERLVAELDAHPDVALVYGISRITAQKNAHFATAPIKRQLCWNEYSHMNLLRHCEMGAQPMWRKAVHDQWGLFQESYTVAGDYDMWLRLAEHYPFRHISEELGLVLEYENNLEGQNPQRSYDETYKAKEEALRRVMQPSFTPEVPFASQLRMYGAKVSKALKIVQQGAELHDNNLLELHFFSYAIALARMGSRTQALEILTIFFSLVTHSQNICHLFRFLLLTSADELPGHLRHEPAPTCQKSAPQASPHISIVLSPPAPQEPAFYLEQALQSVLAQSHRHWELFFLCHTPQEQAQAQALIHKYPDTRLHIFYSPQSAHASWGKRHNEAVAVCTGEFFCVLPSHHMLVPTYFASALELFSSDAAWVSPQSLLIGRDNHLAWRQPYDFIRSLIQCPCPDGALARHSLWQELCGYDEKMPALEAWDFWVRAAEQGHRGCGTAQVEYIIRNMTAHPLEDAQAQIQAKQTYMARHPWCFIPSNTPIELLKEPHTHALPACVLHKERIHQLQSISDPSAIKAFIRTMLS